MSPLSGSLSAYRLFPSYKTNLLITTVFITIATLSALLSVAPSDLGQTLAGVYVRRQKDGALLVEVRISSFFVFHFVVI